MPTPQPAPVSVVAEALGRWVERLAARCSITPADGELLMALPGQTADFGSGVDIVRLSERITHCCLIAKGVAARFGQTSEGARQLTAFYLPGDMGDLHSAVLPRVSAPIQSASFATVVFVPHEALLAAAMRSPRLTEAFWRDCAVDAQIASEWMLNLGRRTAQGRVAHLMCELAVRYAAVAGNTGSFPMHFTQTQLADAAGLTGVHTNRTLRSLREAGALRIQKHRVEILDWSLLTRLGGFDPRYLHLGCE